MESELKIILLFLACHYYAADTKKLWPGDPRKFNISFYSRKVGDNCVTYPNISWHIMGDGIVSNFFMFLFVEIFSIFLMYNFLLWNKVNTLKFQILCLVMFYV